MTLFVAAIVVPPALMNRNEKHPKIPPRSLTVELIYEAICGIESIVQRDGGNIGRVTLPLGELQNAAIKCVDSTSVLLLTGMPMMPKCSPLTGTDEPSGTLAIARYIIFFNVLMCHL